MGIFKHIGQFEKRVEERGVGQEFSQIEIGGSSVILVVMGEVVIRTQTLTKHIKLNT